MSKASFSHLVCRDFSAADGCKFLTLLLHIHFKLLVESGGKGKMESIQKSDFVFVETAPVSPMHIYVCGFIKEEDAGSTGSISPDPVQLHNLHSSPGSCSPTASFQIPFFGEGQMRLLGFRKITVLSFFFSLSYLYMQLDKRAWQPASSEQQTGPVLQQFADK